MRTGVVVGVAILGGLAAAFFARLCDAAMEAHARLYAKAPWATLLLLPIGFGVTTSLTRRFAPAAAGSGIPQVIAAAEERWRGRSGGQRVTLRTALWKVVLTAMLLLCGGSIGREGPTAGRKLRASTEPPSDAPADPGSCRRFIFTRQLG